MIGNCNPEALRATTPQILSQTAPEIRSHPNFSVSRKLHGMDLPILCLTVRGQSNETQVSGTFPGHVKAKNLEAKRLTSKAGLEQRHQLASDMRSNLSLRGLGAIFWGADVDWRIKGIIQKGLSVIPGGVRLNTTCQSVLGSLRDFDSHISGKVEEWILSMNYLAHAGFCVRGSRITEIGTGWHPVFPLCFSLAGAQSLTTFDVTRLMSKTGTFHFLNCLEGYLPKISELAREDIAVVRARFFDYRDSKNLDELLSKSRIDYKAPADGRATGFAPCSMDLVYSNSVLEHVPKDVIRDLMQEGFRVLKPGGLVMHNVACNDHYAGFDSSISFVNFLRYEEREWKIWNNSIQYQNRLRAPEFVELAVHAGFEVVDKRTHIRRGTWEALSSLHVASQFRHFTREDLAATTVDFVCRKAC
jgi:SAM-dependent methyltransferase